MARSAAPAQARWSLSLAQHAQQRQSKRQTRIAVALHCHLAVAAPLKTPRRGLDADHNQLLGRLRDFATAAIAFAVFRHVVRQRAAAGEVEPADGTSHFGKALLSVGKLGNSRNDVSTIVTTPTLYVAKISANEQRCGAALHFYRRLKKCKTRQKNEKYNHASDAMIHSMRLSCSTQRPKMSLYHTLLSAKRRACQTCTSVSHDRPNAKSRRTHRPTNSAAVSCRRTSTHSTRIPHTVNSISIKSLLGASTTCRSASPTPTPV